MNRKISNKNREPETWFQILPSLLADSVTQAIYFFFFFHEAGFLHQ